MGIADIRQMTTNLLGLKGQRREGRRNRLLQSLQFGAGLFSDMSESRKQREFLGDENQADRDARAEQERLGRASQEKITGLSNKAAFKRAGLNSAEAQARAELDADIERFGSFKAWENHQLAMAARGGEKDSSKRSDAMQSALMQMHADPEAFAALSHEEKVDFILGHFAAGLGRTMEPWEEEWATKQVILNILKQLEEDGGGVDTGDATIPRSLGPDQLRPRASTGGGPRPQFVPPRIIAGYPGDLGSVPQTIKDRVEGAGQQLSQIDVQNLRDIEAALSAGPDESGVYEVGGDFVDLPTIQNALRLMIERYGLKLDLPSQAGPREMGGFGSNPFS